MKIIYYFPDYDNNMNFESKSGAVLSNIIDVLYYFISKRKLNEKYFLKLNSLLKLYEKLYDAKMHYALPSFITKNMLKKYIK
jgi:hypothetical protein